MRLTGITAFLVPEQTKFAVKNFDRKPESIKNDRMDLVMTQKMKTGIALFEDFKQYTSSIAKGEKTKKNDEPNTIRFGSSIISNIQPPNKVSTKRNIKAGQDALARAMWKITKPGVVIKRRIFSLTWYISRYILSLEVQHANS